MQILKRNGRVEPFDADKVNAMAVWAIAGNEKLVSWSDIVMLAMKQLPKDNVVPSSMVQDALIKASLEMQTPAYNRVAGRLLLGVIRKTVDVPRSFKQYYQYAVECNLWRKMNYTEQQLDVLEKHINHDKDLEYGYPTLRQFVDKFGRKDADGKLQELPQFMFMGIAMSLFENESLDDVILYYKKASEQKINIPSPIMTGQRTESNVGVSCVIATAGDSLHGIESAKHIAFMATASSAGLGLEYDVRSPKEDVRNGYAKAGGKIPHYKALETITKEVKQQCYSDDTEILTSNGWKLFKDLTDNCLVGQVDDEGILTFVKPLERYSRHYEGEMYHFKDKGKNRKVVDLLVTPNHRMSWRQNKHVTTQTKDFGNSWRVEKSYAIKKEFNHTFAEDFKPKRHTVFEKGSIKNGEWTTLSALDRLRIAFQADGYKRGTSKKTVDFHFKKQRKVDALLEIVKDNFDYTVTLTKAGTQVVRVRIGDSSLLDKEFKWVDLNKVSTEWCREFLLELAKWDGSRQDSECLSFTYSNTNKEAINLVSAVCAVAGVSSSVKESPLVNESHSTLYRLGYAMDRRFVSGRGCSKSKVEYSGKVYCVTVPTGNVMVRRNGIHVVCGNSRGGSATVSFNVLDPEVMTLLSLKLPRSPEERRITQLDYSLLWNTSFLRKVAKNGDWPLASIRQEPLLYEDFSTSDVDYYDKLIDIVLAKPNTVKVKARAIWDLWISNRTETGRIYRTNLTHANQHTPFKAHKIRLSNLCQEVLLPTIPYNHITELYKTEHEDGDGLTALCFLSAIDVARITTDKDYEETTYIVCKSIDMLIDNMTYPFPQWEVTAKAYRSIGVGVTNLAYALAKQGKKYDDIETINKIAERHYYFLLKASIRLAKEKGMFDWIGKTKWVDGWLPIDTYCKNVDKLTTTLHYDWEQLRSEVMEWGVRFSVLAAHMPCESSSVFGSSANSLYPVREMMVLKDGSGGNHIQFFAPECDKYQYELAWDLPFKTVVNMYALFQKFTDQTISADTWIDFTKYENNKIPLSVQTQNYLYADSMGLKTLYYSNHKTDRGNKVVVEETPDCESCSL